MDGSSAYYLNSLLDARHIVNAAEHVTISGTTAKCAAALAAGRYRVRADVACFVRQGIFASIASTVAAGHMLSAGEVWIVVVKSPAGVDDGLAFITAGATGTAEIETIESV